LWWAAILLDLRPRPLLCESAFLGLW
jgi:hypothetical protein